MNINKSVLAIAVTVSMAACASTGQQDTIAQKLQQRGYVQGEQIEDIQNYRLSGWHYVDDEHLIVETEPSRDYLITLRFPCHELMGVEDIGFSNTVGRLTKFDSVVVKSHTGMQRECAIESLYKLESTDKS